MNTFKRTVIGMAIAAAVSLGTAHAQVSDGIIKIGVLTDMSSLYTDLAGAGSVVAAKLAVEDSGIEKRGYKVEVISADHQNKPDVGSNVARQWYDVDKVDVIVDTPNSGVALAVSQITKDKGKAFLASGPGSSDLTGKACSPNTVHWAYDTWMLANGTGTAITKGGGDTTNSIKQAAEFGIVKGGQKLAGLLVFLTDIHALGLQTAQGLTFTETFYW
ncbi:MAG TPA: ABC transporter substrate-binding protein, partial [Casimicrobiaceae bacterium]